MEVSKIHLTFIFICFCPAASAQEKGVLHRMDDDFTDLISNPAVFTSNRALANGFDLSLFNLFYKFLGELTCENSTLGLSSQCCESLLLYKTDLEQLETGLQDITSYAWMARNSFGVKPAGLSYFNVQWLGSYDQCKQAVAPKKDNQYNFVGRYCLPILRSNLTYIPLLSAVCIPDQCTDIDLYNILNNALPSLFWVKNTNCAVGLDFGAEEWVAVAIIGILCVFLVIGTLYEVYLRLTRSQTEQNGTTSDQTNDNLKLVSEPWHSVLISYSAVNNTEKIASMRKRPNEMGCLNGIRIISFIWVVGGHTSAIFFAADNVKEFVLTKEKLFWMPIYEAALAVDTFFFLAGLLVASVTLKELAKSKGRLNWGLFVFHRVWRLTPTYMFVLMFYTVLAPHVTKGPKEYMLYDGYRLTDTCREYWWTNLLYINSYYPRPRDMCMNWSWYLSVDMQFYMVAPFILVAYYKKRWFGVFLSALVAFSSIAATWIFCRLEELYPLIYLQVKNREAGEKAYYWAVFRIAPFIVGMWVAFLFHEKKTLRLKKGWVMLCWAVFTISVLWILYGLYDYYRYSKPMDQDVAAFYLAFIRFAWALCVAWVVVACVYGYGGAVNSILSSAIWKPLSRLSYGAYLIHAVFIDVFAYTLTEPIHFTTPIYVMVVLWICFLGFIGAYFLGLLVESPCVGLEKIMLRPFMRKANRPARPPCEGATEMRNSEVWSTEGTNRTEENNVRM